MAYKFNPFTGTFDIVNEPSAGTAPDASETVKGVVELSTNEEASTGTDTTRAVTPANIKPLLDAKEELAIAYSVVL